jgi:chorismate mutase
MENKSMLKPAIQSSNRPILMAGPCSAESFDQLLATAQSLMPLKIDLFRAGVWKPRTRPNTFEGAGEEGLKWLVEIRDRFGIKIAVEVASANHAEKALKYGIDTLWVGARTTVNPFYVQDIADAIRGTSVPMIVKNPVHADLSLWKGAFERFLKSGIEHISALHRGFYNPDHKVYRNVPLWQVPIDLKTNFPEIQLLCDISHICGRTSNLLETAQIAMDLRYDGLMIEVHPNPSEALSDADQQITGAELGRLLNDLIIRRIEELSPLTRHSLDELRRRIDDIDKDLVELLSARMRLAAEIGLVKREHDIPILQPERWSKVLAQVSSLGKNRGLEEDFIQKMYAAIHEESILKQSKVMNAEITLSQNKKNINAE